jgi:hypothetical protein
MSNIPAELKYSKSHEWVKVEGDTALIGITDHAQEELGEVVYIELPSVGRVLAYDDIFGTVESTAPTKTVGCSKSVSKTRPNSKPSSTPPVTKRKSGSSRFQHRVPGGRREHREGRRRARGDRGVKRNAGTLTAPSTLNT